MTNSKIEKDREQKLAKYPSDNNRENPNQKKFTEFCGKKNGWDDYTERWH